MLRLLLAFCICCTLGHFSIAQNLVPNPSFEEYDTCPTKESQLYRAKGWKINVNTVDYYNKCADTTGYPWFPVFSVPLNAFGSQEASTGNAYAGFFSISKNVLFQDARECLGRKLSVPLISGNEYFVSFKVSLAENSDCATNKIGIKFTNINLGDTTFLPPPFIDNSPHLYTDNVITSSINWVEIKGRFVSDSTYNYFMIGNFFEYSSISTVGSNCNSYYYIDDICVSSDSVECNGLETSIELDYSFPFSVYPNPASSNIYITNSSCDNFSIDIVNLVGQKVKSVNCTQSGTDVSDIPNGTYLLKAKRHNQIFYKKQLIIH
jgi:OOP family OmpA-OmpF porin